MKIHDNSFDPSDTKGVTFHSNGKIKLKSSERYKFVQKFGHLLRYTNDTIECVNCGHTEEMPSFFQKTNPYQQILYQFYMFGVFEQMDCESDDSVEFAPYSHQPDNGNITGVPNGNIHWSNTTKRCDGSIDSTIDKMKRRLDMT